MLCVAVHHSLCNALNLFPVLQQIINASRIILDCSTHGGLSFCCNSYLDSQWLPLLASSAVCRSCWKSSSSWDKGGLFLLALHPSPLISHNYSRIRSIILEVDGSKKLPSFPFLIFLLFCSFFRNFGLQN
jgi:hypothetical protein